MGSHSIPMLLIVFAVLACTIKCDAASANVMTPPKGWNSWDCFQGNLNETGAMAVADTMVKYLLPSGYDILTIDEFWYNNNCAKGSDCTDANGRAQPDVQKWPSSAGGKGFKPFTDKMHEKGLRVGIHTLRGSVSSEALAKNAPIIGGNGATVRDIATTVCPWNSEWYSINMSHPASQPWLDSVYSQYADWGVDLIKNDCIFANDFEETVIKGVSKAIQKTSHPTVYSLSPGGNPPRLNHSTEFDMAKSIAGDVNIYRVTGDWHGGDMGNHFSVAAAMQPLINVDGLNGKSYPDLDMLNPYTNASSDPNFKAQMTLWSMARSPLIYGADLREHPDGGAWSANDFALLTNPKMLEITDESSNNMPINVDQSAGIVAWKATGTHGSYYIGVISSSAPHDEISTKIGFPDFGVTNSEATCTVTDIWTGKVSQVSGEVSISFVASQAYSSTLLLVNNCN